jgi:MYXO-CTERM domain-containing protein
MSRRAALAMLALALLLAVVPTAAQAKGASGATISGGGGSGGGLPGGPIDIKGDGEPGSGSDLSTLAEEAGMWAVLFEGGPAGGVKDAPTPAAQRGPRYTITWTFPNGAGTEDKVRQFVWPYAAGGPVTYLAPGQKVLDTRSEGGWYQASDVLRRSLIDLGLPNRPALTAPASPGSGSAAPASPSVATPVPADPAPAVWPKVAAGVALLLVAAAVVLLRRRRTTPGPAATH